MAEWLPWITAVLGLLGALGAAVRYTDQRRRELEAKRFDQYWRLVDIAHDTTMIGKQNIAILQLRKFPEFAFETRTFLETAQARDSGWVRQNMQVIDVVLSDPKIMGQRSFIAASQYGP